MIAPHEVTVEVVSARDQYGAPTFGTPLVKRACVRTGRVRVTTREGQHVVARGVAYIEGDVDVAGTGASITVPAAFAMPSRMPVVSATRTPDRSGNVAVTEVYF